MSTPRQVIRRLTVNEVSTVDRPAQPGATVAIIKSVGGDVAIRKSANDLAGLSSVDAFDTPLHKSADYEEALFRRADELARERGVTKERALTDAISGNDAVAMDLAHAYTVAKVREHGDRTARRLPETA